MRNASLSFAMFCLGLLSAPARAADPALVAGTEKYLNVDEKSILAAVLVDGPAGAEFDADASDALSDPKTLKLLLDKWRGRFAAFAETDSLHPGPDLEGTYRNYAEMLTPQMRAYLAKRVPLLSEKERNELIGYLKDINRSLADDGHLSWYTKRVTSGIMDRYRSMLRTYAASPLAQDGKRNGPAAALALAQRREEAVRMAQAERDRLERERLAAAKPVEVPAAIPAAKPGRKPKTPPTQVASGARGQAEDAARSIENASRVFDGGAGAVVPGAVAAGPGEAKPPVLTPAVPGGKPALAGSIPPAPTSVEDDFMSRLESQQTKQPRSLMSRYLPAGVGALLLGAAGFSLGGPLGALLGAIVGAALGRG